MRLRPLLWRFLTRYGMQPIYRTRDALVQDVKKFYMSAYDRGSRAGMFYAQSASRFHIDPRGYCGNTGKVLCYKWTNGVWQFSSKHKKTKTYRISNCRK